LYWLWPPDVPHAPCQTFNVLGGSAGLTHRQKPGISRGGGQRIPESERKYLISGAVGSLIGGGGGQIKPITLEI